MTWSAPMPLQIAQPRSQRFDEIAEAAWRNTGLMVEETRENALGNIGLMGDDKVPRDRTAHILAALDEAHGMTTTEYASRYGVVRETARRWLSALRRRGLVEMDRARRNKRDVWVWKKVVP